MHEPRVHLQTGFAAAVLPISAATIATDASGLDAGEVQIPAGNTTIPGYRAMPAGGKTFPVVLLIQEIFGVHEHIKDVCRRFAKLGYMAIAPEMYARQGDVLGMSDIQQIIEKVVSKVPDAQVMSDLDATVAYAESTGRGDTSRLGITGFCWGGRAVWLYAAHSSKLKAGGAWYGQLIGLQNEYRTRTALDVAPELKAPVIGFYGGQDHGIPLDQVERMQRSLRDAGKESEILVYPDAGHGFFADYRPGYNESAAQDAWANLLEWFRKHGVA
jgi:carboxymethylenebutenolidase